MNFWGYIINGLLSIVAFIIGYMPTHNTIGIASEVLTIANTSLGILYIFLLKLVNPFWGITVIGVILIGEAIRYIYATWRWFRRIIEG
jgi:hypothetical protein